MSLFGSLFTGVSALSAQSQALSMISNNIANISTVGYKEDNAAFSSLVTVAQRGVNYNPGGVRVKTLQTINRQGLVQGSSSTTDIAISGDGFFIVKDTPTNDGQRALYTRAGNFTEDSTGFLRNASGYYLQGWVLDALGEIPAANADISSTQPVNVAFLNGVATGTLKVELGVNLDSEQKLGATSDTFTDPTSTAELTTALNATAPFTYDFDVTVTNEAGVATTTNLSITDANNLNDVATAINGVTGVSASVINGQLVVTADNVDDKVTIANGTTGSVATNLFGSSSLTQLGYDFRRTVRLFDSLGAPRDVEVSFKKQAVNQWLVEVRATDKTFVQPVNRTTGLVDTVTGDDGYIASGVLNFNSDGSIGSVSGQLATPIKIRWDPAYSGAGTQEVNFDFGVDPSGQPSKGALTQFASDYNVSFVNQNGAELGQRTGISIDENGYVVASFSNGEFRKLYKIPIATFANANGLQTRSGNVFAQTTDSGQYNLREAGSGGAGLMQGGSLEMSNVDLSNEFTKMIVTQRAYSAGTKVISTADDMLQELMQIKR